MNTTFDDAKARLALGAIATQSGLSARVCRAILTYADSVWQGSVECALLDIREGVFDRATLATHGIELRQVLAFVGRLPRTFGTRPKTAEELASDEAARFAEIAARAADYARTGRKIGQPEPLAHVVQTGCAGNYSPATGDGLRDAATWAAEAYACGDSISDD